MMGFQTIDKIKFQFTFIKYRIHIFKTSRAKQFSSKIADCFLKKNSGGNSFMTSLQEQSVSISQEDMDSLCTLFFNDYLIF